MKKVAFLIIILLTLGTISVKAQYTEDKLPSGLTVAADVDSADYIVLQKSGETYVKAAIAYKFYEYLLAQLGTVASLNLSTLYVSGTAYIDSIVATYLNVSGQAEIDSVIANYVQVGTVNFDSIEGSQGELLASDGSGWAYKVPGKFETSTNYSFTFGTRASGTVGDRSYSFGSGNVASGAGSVTIGRDLISSDNYAFTTGTGNENNGLNSVILSGEDNTIATSTERNAINSSTDCEVVSGDNNTINNSDNISISGGNNFVNNCINSDFVTKQSFISHSQYSQYKGADSVSFVYGSGADTVDLGKSLLMFSQFNKGIIKSSNVSFMDETAWTDTIIYSYLYNIGFYNDTLTRAEGLTAINADNMGIKDGVSGMFTANSEGIYFSNELQSVFGTWNDSTPSTSDRLFQVGNGSGAGARADALCVYANGDVDISGKLTAKTLVSTDSAYLTKCVSQFHMIDSMAAYVVDTWTNITWDTVIANESTSCFSFNDDSTAFIYTGRAGIIRIQGCFHTLWDGSNGTTASIFGRARVNGVEARCTQAENTKEKNANDRGILPIIGTVYVEQGDTVDIQFRVTNLDYYLDGNDAVFDNAVGASINFEYMSQDN